MFRRLAVRSKVRYALGLALAPLVIALAAAFWAVEAGRSVNESVTVAVVPELLELTDLRDRGVRLIESLDKLALLAATLHDQPEKLAEAVGRQRSALDSSLQSFAAALSGFHSGRPGQATTARDDVAAAARALLAMPDQSVARISAAPSADEILKLRRQFKDAAYQFRKLIDQAVASEQSDLSAGGEQLGQIFETALAVIGGGILLVLAAYWFSVAHLTRHIVRPLLSLRDAALRLGAGDFSAPPERAGDDEIGEVIDSFRSMSEQLRAAHAKQERLAAIGQVVGMVSHELRNPLATVRNSIDMVRRATADKNLGTERALERMQRAIGRCDVIVADLLEFFRDRELQRMPTKLDAWLGEMLDEHNIPGDVTVSREFGFGGELKIDPDRFRQVIVNLVDNAVQAMKDPNNPQPREHRLSVRT